jgi:putative ABC transport system substrate-binding protein
MRELGYIEGKNLVVESRFADNKLERLPGLAAELVQLKLDAIVSGNTSPTRALQKATTNIPIIMTNDPDPVAAGFVKSLAHPGGNITGLSIAALDISPKLLEMLRSMMPELSRVAVLVNPANASHSPIVKSIEAAAQKIGVTIVALEARTSKEIEDGFVNMARQRLGALIVPGDGFFNAQAREIAELATRNRLRVARKISAIRIGWRFE